MIPLEEIFTVIDDFCKHFEQTMARKMLPSAKRQRNRPCRMSSSEIMTIVVLFHFSHYRTFKDFYLNCILKNKSNDFPKALSYTRFVEVMPSVMMPLHVLLHSFFGHKTGKYFVDSTKLSVCHNLRIRRNKVFKGMAQRGKTSTGWFFGFKLHLVLNHQGGLMGFKMTKGNVDDRKPVQNMVKQLQGWLFGDRGYISKNLSQELQDQGLELITTMKRNMKKILLSPLQKFLLNKRGIIETAIDQLKNMLHIQHTRHRSPLNFQVNVLAGLLAYILKPKKVSVPFAALNNLLTTPN